MVLDEKGLNRLAFVPKAEKKEWNIECDGFSMKIKHQKTGEYLGKEDETILLTKEPQYWQVFESSKNSI